MKKLHWFSNIKWGETYLSLMLGCPWNILFSCALDIWLRVRIAHYSKSPIFVQKFNFDKIFEFLRQNWKNIHEYFILKSVKWLSFRGINFDFDPKLNLQNNGKKIFWPISGLFHIKFQTLYQNMEEKKKYGHPNYCKPHSK